MADQTRYSAEEIYTVAREAGFSPDQAATMTAIALAESGGRSDAHNPSGEDSRGLWQINVKAHTHLEDADLYDPRVNADAAFEVSRGGTDISPWTVTHGEDEASYLRFREQAEAAAEAAGDGQGRGSWEGVTGYGDRTPAGEPAPPDGEAAVGEETVSEAEAPENESALEAFLESALAQAGDEYEFGAETHLDDPDPDEFDCSELVQWAAHQAGVTVPDGAIWQYRHLAKEGTTMSVEEALQTPGALLFRFSSDPSPGGGRPASAHVAISLGDGRTIEARGESYGVGSWEASESRFQYAGYVPAFGNEPLADEPDTAVPPPDPSTPVDVPATPGDADDEIQPLDELHGADEDDEPPPLDELRELEETYSTAAQVLHDDSLATLEKAHMPELVDAYYEHGGLKAQLKGLPGHRAGYEERMREKREEADELNAESTRLEELGRTKEAEEKLEEALRTDASARLDQSRIDALDQREQALRERLEEVEARIAEGLGAEKQTMSRVDDLEKSADALDDARRAVQEAIQLREQAARLEREAGQARAEGDEARAKHLEDAAEEAVQRSEVHVAHARATVPDTDVVREALQEAEELNRVSVVLVGEDADGAALEPEIATGDLLALRADYDRASEALHFEALEELRAAGQVQVQAQNVLHDRAQGLGAELEHVRGQAERAAQALHARETQAARLREEAAELERRGDHALAEEKLEQADRVDVLKDVSAQALSRWSARAEELAGDHREALDGATAARQTALGHAARESELEQTADHIDDATRLLEQALEARTEAQRLGLEATQARTAGDLQRHEQLRARAAEQVARSDSLAREARAAVTGNVAATAAVEEARLADPGRLLDIDGDGDASGSLDELDGFGGDLDGDLDSGGVPETPAGLDPLGEGHDGEGEADDADANASIPTQRLSQDEDEDELLDPDFGAPFEPASDGLEPVVPEPVLPEPDVSEPELADPAFAEPAPTAEPEPAPVPAGDDADPVE